MPQYHVGHLDWVKAVEDALAGYPGLFVAGSSYRGAGIPDCVRQGREAAEAVREFISEHRTSGAPEPIGVVARSRR
jgi:oxygen-dependent protoporphyrinogen oxidase